MPTAEKAKVIDELKERIDAATAVYIVDYMGIDVDRLTGLRRGFREAKSEFKVVKNTLTRIAASSIGKDELIEYLSGPTALVVCEDDVVEPAKVLDKFIKDNKGLIRIKGGLIEGQVIPPEDVQKVADIPPREQLLAQLVGNMQSPVSGFVGVLSGVLRNVVGVFDAIAKEKEKAD